MCVCVGGGGGGGGRGSVWSLFCGVVLGILFTVLSAKSDSDFIFVCKVIRDLSSIDHLCFYPILRIGLIHK